MATEEDSQLKFRVERGLRERLEEAAAKNGVSLNKEITDRLLRSFETSSLHEDRPSYGILKLLQEAMNVAGESALFQENDFSWEIARQKKWTDSALAYGRAMEAAITILEALRPPGHPPADHHLTPWDGRFHGEYFLKWAATGKPNVPENQQLATDLKASLGDLANRLADFRNIDPKEEARARQTRRAKK